MRAFDAAIEQPWAIQEPALQSILEIAARTREERGMVDLEAVAAKVGRPLDNAQEVTVRDGVAIIPISGPIFRYANLFTRISGATSVEETATNLRTALDDSSIRAVLLQIDSPGGQVAGISELAEHIYQARGEKPVYAHVSHMGCSAAYWLASAAEDVACADTAMLGSIGIIAAYRKSQDDSKVEFVSSQSPNKNPDPETESGKSQIQEVIDATAEVFIAAVARYRGVSEETVQADFGQGGVLVGQDAVDAGMADRVGSFEETLAACAGAGQDRAAERRPTFGGRMATAVALAGKENQRMSAPKGNPVAAAFLALGAALGLNVKAEDKEPENPQAAAPAPDTAAASERDAARRELAQERAKRFDAEATAFYAQELSAGRVFPAEKAEFVSGFVQAAQDDTVSPLASGSRVEVLKARQAKRVPHDLTKEQLAAMDPSASAAEKPADTQGTALENKADTGKKEQAATVSSQEIYAQRAKVTGSR